MTLPLSTPGKCCGHNLNTHSGNGLEGTCIICSCVGFEPDTCYNGHAKGCEHMAIGPNELRQCRAVLRSETDGDLRCQGEVTEQTIHPGDHWAFVGLPGTKIRWTESVAVYPVPDDVRASDPTMGAEVVREKLAEKGIGNGAARLAQVGGEHYRKFKIQPWDVIDEYGLGFYAGNALKYLLRAGHKGSKAEDLKKCRHYLDKLIELEEGGNGQ